MTGLKEATGKTARELVPNLEAFWFEIYGSVVQTGQPVRFENQSIAMNRWFDVNAFCIGEEQSINVWGARDLWLEQRREWEGGEKAAEGSGRMDGGGKPSKGAEDAERRPRERYVTRASRVCRGIDAHRSMVACFSRWYWKWSQSAVGQPCVSHMSQSSLLLP